MKLNKEFKIRKIAGENIIVRIGTHDVDMTKVISLNATSVWLWEKLTDVDFTAKTVADLLTEQYEVDGQKALQDSKTWIEALDKAGLLEK